jgi:hypothetical protein
MGSAGAKPRNSRGSSFRRLLLPTTPATIIGIPRSSAWPMKRRRASVHVGSSRRCAKSEPECTSDRRRGYLNAVLPTWQSPRSQAAANLRFERIRGTTPDAGDTGRRCRAGPRWAPDTVPIRGAKIRYRAALDGWLLEEEVADGRMRGLWKLLQLRESRASLMAYPVREPGEAAQDGDVRHDPLVLGRAVSASQQVGNLPDQVGK